MMEYHTTFLGHRADFTRFGQTGRQPQDMCGQIATRSGGYPPYRADAVRAVRVHSGGHTMLRLHCFALLQSCFGADSV